MAKLKEQKFTCQGCGIRNVPFEVHHVEYRNIYDCTVVDLEVRCRPCHAGSHGVEREMGGPSRRTLLRRKMKRERKRVRDKARRRRWRRLGAHVATHGKTW